MTFLIDFENVGNNGFDGIEQLTPTDTLIIFYSNKAKSLSMDTHCKLEDSLVQKEYICVEVGGKNALDFQLSTYLGYLLATQTEETYYIVSKDEGFSFITNFWEKHEQKIIRCTNLYAKSCQTTSDQISELLADYKDYLKEISNILATHKTKQAVNNALVKTYGSETAGILYNKIRPLL
ncbi:MAG: PIN domain-containing protein [Eubacteriales bacterium]